MSDPGGWTKGDWRRYHLTALRIAWGTMSPREVKRLRKRDPFFVTAIEGIVKYD